MATTLAAPSTALNYNDLAGLNALNTLARSDKAAALDQVAKQFESFFISQMLKGMRSANEVFAADDPMNSNEMQFRQDMLDQQLSLSLTQGRGLGIATMFARQLRQQMGVDGNDNRADTAVLDQGRLVDRDGRAEPRVPARPASPVADLPVVMRRALDVVAPVVERAREAIREVGVTDDKAGFVAALLPYAKRAAQALGVDHRVLIAQAALETGWGKSVIRDERGRSSNNLFNIKSGSYWEGDAMGATTLEFEGGLPRPLRAMFRAYASFAESFDDYAGMLLNNSRYRQAIEQAGSAAGFLHGLQDAGYATDPRYAEKVLRLLGDAAIAGAQ